MAQQLSTTLSATLMRAVAVGPGGRMPQPEVVHTAVSCIVYSVCCILCSVFSGPHGCASRRVEPAGVSDGRGRRRRAGQWPCLLFNHRRWPCLLFNHRLWSCL